MQLSVKQTIKNILHYIALILYFLKS